MLRVPTTQATAGMRLALPVVHPERGTKLLSEGFLLDKAMVVRLQNLQVRDIWIDYPGTEQIKQYVSPAILNQQARVVELVAGMFDPHDRDAHAVMEFTQYRRAIRGLIECLVMEPAAAAYIVELGGSTDSELRHAGEVCFLSVLLGLKLQGYLVSQRRRLHPIDARDVTSLGLGAALHDLGKTELRPEARKRYELTRDERDPDWRRHPMLGHKLISGEISPSAAGVVLHHHQHFDGSGFPTTIGDDGRAHGLAGEQIHVFARIVCVANHFDRMRCAGDGSVVPRVRVLKQMLTGPMAARFDPVILAALPIVVPAFPPGSVVTLSNGQRAIVIKWHAEAPCQPTVQLMLGNELHNVQMDETPVQIDLRHDPELSIVEHENQDVSSDHFRVISDTAHRQKFAA